MQTQSSLCNLMAHQVINCFAALSSAIITAYNADTESDCHSPSQIGLDWIVQCFTSRQHSIGYIGELQVKRPNQQYQSIEGESCKGKQPKNTKKTKITHMQCIHTQNSILIQHTRINTASPLVYNYIG